MMPPWGRTTPKGATAIAASNNVGKDFGSEHPIHTAAHTQPGNPRTTVVEGHSGQYRCPCFLAPRVDCHHAAHQSPLCVASLRRGGTHDLPTLQPCCLHCRSLVASSPMHAHAARLHSSPAGRHLPCAITPHASTRVDGSPTTGSARRCAGSVAPRAPLPRNTARTANHQLPVHH